MWHPPATINIQSSKDNTWMNDNLAISFLYWSILHSTAIQYGYIKSCKQSDTKISWNRLKWFTDGIITVRFIIAFNLAHVRSLPICSLFHEDFPSGWSRKYDGFLLPSPSGRRGQTANLRRAIGANQDCSDAWSGMARRLTGILRWWVSGFNLVAKPQNVNGERERENERQ